MGELNLIFSVIPYSRQKQQDRGLWKYYCDYNQSVSVKIHQTMKREQRKNNMKSEILNRLKLNSEHIRHTEISETIQTISEHMAKITTHNSKADLYFEKGITVFCEMKDNLGPCCWQSFQQLNE